LVLILLFIIVSTDYFLADSLQLFLVLIYVEVSRAEAYSGEDKEGRRH
jgi:hypothetical protein